MNIAASLPIPRDGAEARSRVRELMRRVEAYADPAVWIYRLSDGEINVQLEQVIQRREAGTPQPLFGLTFAIKDNIDLANAPTTAACPEFSYLARQSATVVARLCDAGAIAVGKTNLDQFATGLVGTRSPYGAVRNPYNPEYIAGGSSSGSAAAVAAGLVDFSLGTDTAGSGRVPASFCNLVGLKPTRGLVSTSGCVPACRSLDCISVFTRNCEQAELAFSIIRAFDETDIYSRRDSEVVPLALPTTGFRFGVPRDQQLEFFGNEGTEWLYRHAIHHAMGIGGKAVEIDFAPFQEAAQLLYQGPWVAERWVACKEILARNPEAVLPITRKIIGGGSAFSAADTFEAEYRLLELRRRTEREWEKMDTLLLPTTGTIYTIAQVQADPVRLNTNLGYYTNFTNLLDLCALALPNGFQPDGLPAGITFMARAGADDWLMSIGKQFESNIERGVA